MSQLAQIQETLAFLDDWEDRYRYIIELGDMIQPLPPDQCTDQNLVKGCQSLVWLVCEHDLEADQLRLRMYSDASIVRGLISIVLAAFDSRSPKQIADFDLEDLFSELDLVAHLSMARGNGLRSMVAAIRNQARRIANQAQSPESAEAATAYSTAGD